MSELSQPATHPPALIEQILDQPDTVLCRASHTAKGSAFLLFTAPRRYITAYTAAEMHFAFAAIEHALGEGLHVAGYLTYEAGLALHGLAAHPLTNDEPLLCFGVYGEPQHHSAFPAEAETNTPESNLALLPTVPLAQYCSRIGTLQQWIADGDIYQANYTVPLRSWTTEKPSSLYRALLRQQPAAYAAIIHLQNAPIVLSFSPELFFCTDDSRHIHTQPMKGTAPRSDSPEQDRSSVAWLAADAKNRAEHIMIVDLLRNDLGRICESGSVRAENLFHVESLPSVHQMVSDVHGRLRESLRWLEIFTALFPSGSVTGAPKRRALQLLHQVENAPRGVYTGAIGYIASTGESCFSVAIRTLTLRERDNECEITYGVGGGIVADSTANGEYREALLKSAFVRRTSKPLKIIETVRTQHGQVRWLNAHLDRMERTAETLAFPFDRQAIHGKLVQTAGQTQSAPQRTRIVLDSTGHLDLHSEPLDTWPETLRVQLSPERSHLGDPALANKTNFREGYDRAFRQARKAGFQEVLYANDAGLLTEGCVTNLFFVRDGCIYTPYTECGVLPGILRGELLRHDLIEESLLPLGALDTCEALLLGNSLRGLYPVQSLQCKDWRTLTWDTAKSRDRIQQIEAVLFQNETQ